MIPVFVILVLFSVSLAMTLTRGVAATFTFVLLPTLLVLFGVDPVEVQKLPDITGIGAVGYGVLIAQGIKGDLTPPFKLSLLDGLVVAMSINVVLSGVINEEIWTGVSLVGNQTLEVMVPYFMGRVAFLDRHWRMMAAKVVLWIAVPLSFISLVEMRLVPMFFSRAILAPFGLTDSDYVQVLQRFGLFRAQASFSHPIDLGNGGVLLACMLVALACSSGAKLRTPWVLLGVVCCLLMSAASISFTSFVAVAAILGLFAMLRLSRLGGWVLVPIVIAAIAFYIGLTRYFIETPLPGPIYEIEGTVNASTAVRQLIVQNTWVFAQDSGLFGYNKTVTAKMLDLQSVDNAYMLFLLHFGFLYLTLFLLAGIYIAGRAGLTLTKIREADARVPLAAGVAGIIGTMLGMYTVFFGFVYAKLFLILIAFVATMSQMALARINTGKPMPSETDNGRPMGAPAIPAGGFPVLPAATARVR